MASHTKIVCSTLLKKMYVKTRSRKNKKITFLNMDEGKREVRFFSYKNACETFSQAQSIRRGTKQPSFFGSSVIVYVKGEEVYTENCLLEEEISCIIKIEAR